MGTGSFPGVESGRGMTLTPHPLLVPRYKNHSTAIPLLFLRAFVACKKGETLPIQILMFRDITLCIWFIGIHYVR
jgi:hypothetical protein